MPQGPDDLLPGYYKTRVCPRGPYAPVKVWEEKGEFCRIREGKLFSHMVLRCTMDGEEIDPFGERGGFLRCMFFEDIDKDEFEFITAMKELREW